MKPLHKQGKPKNKSEDKEDIQGPNKQYKQTQQTSTHNIA